MITGRYSESALNALQLGICGLRGIIVLHIKRVDALIPHFCGAVLKPLGQRAQHIHIRAAFDIQHIAAFARAHIMISTKMLQAIANILLTR